MIKMRFSIRTLLLAIMSVLNLLIAIPVGLMMYNAIISYQQAQEIRNVTETTSYLYTTKQYLSLERASALSIMFVSQAAFERMNVQFQESREKVDDSLRHALASLKNEENPDVVNLSGQIMHLYSNLETLRVRMDAQLKNPTKNRDFSLGDRFFDESTALIDKIDAIIEEYSRVSTQYNPVIGRQMRFVRLIWEISEYAGREYAVLGKLIAKNQFPAVETQRQLSVWRNRIQYGLELARGNVRNNAWGEEIVPYMEAAETNYAMIFERIKDIFYQPTTAPVASILPINVEMWLDLASQAVNSLYGMTDAAMEINQRYVEKIEADAERAIFISVLFFASVLALSLSTWWLVTARVIIPVNSMIDALYHETLIDNQQMPEQDNQDEIAKLEQVLKVFQKNSHQLQEERDKAQAASVAKSEFLANMSHEIRTPMNVVVGLSNILARSGPLSAKQAEFIKTLQISAESLLSLINDLLDFSKIEAQSLELEKIPFNFVQLVEELTMVKSFKAKEKGLNFEASFSDLDGKEYMGDPTRIRQILQNLCGNAIKFTAKGTIKLDIKAFPSILNGYENIQITVNDTGIGIASEKLEAIFEKFTQADASITRKYGGTGLGLAITKSLIEIMGGEIGVKSELGQGTLFTATIPLARKIQTPSLISDEREEEIISHKQDNEKILIVEDYHPNAVVAGSFLEEFGYKYDVVENGQQAIQKIMEGPYSIVLMDVQMPGMDGYEATRAIRKYEAERGNIKPVKIIGLTAHATLKDKEKCLSAGMNDYLSKPFDPKKLRQKLSV